MPLPSILAPCSDVPTSLRANSDDMEDISESAFKGTGNSKPSTDPTINQGTGRNRELGSFYLNVADQR